MTHFDCSAYYITYALSREITAEYTNSFSGMEAKSIVKFVKIYSKFSQIKTWFQVRPANVRPAKGPSLSTLLDCAAFP